MSAGDMLYLPPGWFHEVKSHGKHAAINFWMVDGGQ
jgi:ribosomal protein L16 Arg81 hydroxylase